MFDSKYRKTLLWGVCVHVQVVYAPTKITFIWSKTYPICPFDRHFSSRSSVALTLLSEYRPIGELNCLCTSFRCTVAIVLSFLRYLVFSFRRRNNYKGTG